MLSYGVLLLEHVLLFTDLAEPGVLKSLGSGYTIVSVVDKQLFDQVNDFGRGLRDQLCNACSDDLAHAEFCEVHVRGVTLEFVKQSFLWCAQNVMDLVHLIKLIVAREKWEQ